jgi:hypothetical protein
MQKIQILFPEPQMRRLREQSKLEDRPISEIVRRATEAWLTRCPAGAPPAGKREVPVFRGGRILLPASRLRDEAYRDRIESVAEGRP